MTFRPGKYAAWSQGVTGHLNTIRRFWNDAITGNHWAREFWADLWHAINTIGAIQQLQSQMQAVTAQLARQWAVTSYGIANLSWYTARALHSVRGQVIYTRSVVIPSAFRAAENLTRVMVAREVVRRRAAVWNLHKYLISVIESTAKGLLKAIFTVEKELKADLWNQRQYIMSVLNARVKALLQADFLLEREFKAGLWRLHKYVMGQVHALAAYAHGIEPRVNKQASAGYNASRAAEASGIVKLLDFAAVHEPLVKDLVGKLSATLLDLASVEDPAVRLAASLVLRQVIDRLGIDSVLGRLVNDAVGGFLAGGQPSTLYGVERRTGGRLNELEQFAAGMAPLAGEADVLKDMGSPLFDAALAAFFGFMVADPAGWANDVHAVIKPGVDVTLAAVNTIMGGPS